MAKTFLKNKRLRVLTAFLLPLLTTEAAPAGPPALPLIRPSPRGAHFVEEPGGRRFFAWGFNYDHDRSGRLLEAYWEKEWSTVVEDFKEMKALGARVVRIHLQVGAFMQDAHACKRSSLEKLGELLSLAESLGLYLDVTGLGCYHKEEIPLWYRNAPEQERWQTQARFWEAVSKVSAGSNAVFCYNLMNEPILPGRGKPARSYLAGSFGGKYFVQRITLDLAGRSRAEVATAWVRLLTSAIRKHDRTHMITVAVIPWAHHFPGAKPIFYSERPGGYLDCTAVHFYPKKGQVDRAVQALKVYDLGKPLLVEELFPLRCSIHEALRFVENTSGFADGYLSFYWGKTPSEYSKERTIQAGIIGRWISAFSARMQAKTSCSAPPPGCNSD